MQIKNQNTGNTSYPQIAASNTESLLTYLQQALTGRKYSVTLVENRDPIASTTMNIDGLPKGLLLIGFAGAVDVKDQDDMPIATVDPITYIVRPNNPTQGYNWYYKVNTDTGLYERERGVMFQSLNNTYNCYTGYGFQDVRNLILTTMLAKNAYWIEGAGAAPGGITLPACSIIIDPGQLNDTPYGSLNGPTYSDYQNRVCKALSSINSFNWINFPDIIAGGKPDLINGYATQKTEEVLQLLNSISASDLQTDDFSLNGYVDLWAAEYNATLYNNGAYKNYAVCLDYNQYDEPLDQT